MPYRFRLEGRTTQAENSSRPWTHVCRGSAKGEETSVSDQSKQQEKGIREVLGEDQHTRDILSHLKDFLAFRLSELGTLSRSQSKKMHAQPELFKGLLASVQRTDWGGVGAEQGRVRGLSLGPWERWEGLKQSTLEGSGEGGSHSAANIVLYRAGSSHLTLEWEDGLIRKRQASCCDGLTWGEEEETDDKLYKAG